MKKYIGALVLAVVLAFSFTVSSSVLACPGMDKDVTDTQTTKGEKKS